MDLGLVGDRVGWGSANTSESSRQVTATRYISSRVDEGDSWLGKMAVTWNGGSCERSDNGNLR